MEECKKKEYTLNIDKYNNIDILEDNRATINLILNLLFSDEYTYPSIPDSVGVNISKYKFRVLDDSTIITLKNELEEKIQKYIPFSNIKDIVIKKYNDTSLLIGLKFYTDNQEVEDNINIIKIEDSNNTYNIKVL